MGGVFKMGVKEQRYWAVKEETPVRVSIAKLLLWDMWTWGRGWGNECHQELSAQAQEVGTFIRQLHPSHCLAVSPSLPPSLPPQLLGRSCVQTRKAPWLQRRPKSRPCLRWASQTVFELTETVNCCHGWNQRLVRGPDAGQQEWCKSPQIGYIYPPLSFPV